MFRQRNLGLPSARNTGIKRTVGKYVCCLDADDMLDPTYLEKAVDLLECRPDIGFAYPWVRRFGQGEGVWENEEYNFSELIRRNLLNHPAVFRRRAWSDVGGFWDGLRDGYEDWEFWIHLGIHGHPGARIPEPLFLYRKHGRSMIDEAVEKHEILVGRIRERHRKVYEDARQIQKIERSFKDREVDMPFLNLSRRDQFLQPTGSATALITDGSQEELIDKLLSLPSTADDRTTRYLIATIGSRHCRRVSAETSGVYSYYLPDFMPNKYWADFAINLLDTRRVSQVWLTQCKLSEQLGNLLRSGKRGIRLVLCATEEQDLNWIRGWNSALFDEVIVTSDFLAAQLQKGFSQGKQKRVIKLSHLASPSQEGS